MRNVVRRSWRSGVRIFKRFAMAPSGLNVLGDDSVIERPWKISNPGCIRIGSRTRISGYSWLEPITAYAGQEFKPRLSIGDDVYLGHRCCITCVDQVVIGNGCVLSEEVYIADSAHGYDPEGGLIMQQRLHSKGPVILEESCFVGYRAVITPGVRLGRHCVVGANSVVTKSFPAYSMVAGAPARLIKSYDPELKTWIESSRGVSA